MAAPKVDAVVYKLDMSSKFCKPIAWEIANSFPFSSKGKESPVDRLEVILNMVYDRTLDVLPAR